MIFVACFFVVLLGGSLAFTPSGMQIHLLILRLLKAWGSFTSLATCFPVLQPQLSLGSDPNPFHLKEKPQQAWFLHSVQTSKKVLQSFFLTCITLGNITLYMFFHFFLFFLSLREALFITFPLLQYYTTCAYIFLYMCTCFYIFIHIYAHIYVLPQIYNSVTYISWLHGKK